MTDPRLSDPRLSEPVDCDVVEGVSSFLVIVRHRLTMPRAVGMGAVGADVEVRLGDGRRVAVTGLDAGFTARAVSKSPHLALMSPGELVLSSFGAERAADGGELVPAAFLLLSGPFDGPRSLAGRPFAELLAGLQPASVALSPGAMSDGTPVGLGLRAGAFAPLARGRFWERISTGLTAERGLAYGTSAGHPVDDDLEDSVARAHASATPASAPCAAGRPRRVEARLGA